MLVSFGCTPPSRPTAEIAPVIPTAVKFYTEAIRCLSTGRRSRCTHTATTHDDGRQQLRLCKGYRPNSYDELADQNECREPPDRVHGNIYHHDLNDCPNDDCFKQGWNLWRPIPEDGKAVMMKNIATDMASIAKNMKCRHATHRYLADPGYCGQMSRALDLDFETVKVFKARPRKIGRGDRMKMRKVLFCIVGAAMRVLGAMGPLPCPRHRWFCVPPYVMTGSPRLYKWLTNTRYFGPIIKNHRGGAGVPVKTEIFALASLVGNAGTFNAIDP